MKPKSFWKNYCIFADGALPSIFADGALPGAHELRRELLVRPLLHHVPK